MTYREDFTLPARLLEQVQQQGLEVLPELIRVIINLAMQAERSGHLKAELYQHTPERSGHTNGYIPKTMRTRWCRLDRCFLPRHNTWVRRSCRAGLSWVQGKT